MRPISLTIKGLYSYRRETVIDFQRLTNARLFGIFGPVGSGKSSIIEAITFALYGRNERLNQHEQSINMMNLRSKELLIDFTFSSKGETYRFTVSEKRRKKFEETTNWEKQGYRLDGETWVPLFSRNREVTAEEVLGLSYENFKRAVIIPQGLFQEFIRLGGAQRTQMMKELFHLERFDLFDNASTLLTNTERQLAEITARMSEIGEVEEGTIFSKKEELANAEAELTRFKEELKTLRKEEQKTLEVKELLQRKEKARSLLSSLTDGEEDFLKRKAALEEYNRADRQLRPLLNSLAQREEEISRIKGALSQANEEALRLEEEGKERETEYLKAEERWEHREEDKKMIETWELLLHLREVEKEHREQSTLQKALEKKGKEIEEDHRKLKNEIAALKEHLKTLRDDTLPEETITGLSLWYERYNTLKKRKTEGKEELLRLWDRLRRTMEKAALDTPLVTGQPPEDLETLTRARSTLDAALRKKEEAVSTKRETLQKERARLEEKTLLTRFAEELSPGKPCPLCGSTEHPAVLSPAGEAAAEKTEEDQKALKEKEGKLEEEKELLVSTKTGTELIIKDSKDRIEKLKEEETLLKDLEASFQWKDFSPKGEDAFLKKREETKTTLSEIEEKENTIEEREKDLEDLEKKKEKKEVEKREARDKMVSLETEMKTLRDTLEKEQRDFSKYRELAEEELKKHIEEKGRYIDESEEIFQKAREMYETVKNALSQAKGRKETRAQQLADAGKQIEEEQKELEEALQRHAFSSRQEAEMALKEMADPEGEAKAIQDFYTDLESAKRQYQELEESSKDQSYNEEAYKELLSRIEAAEEKQTELSERRGALINTIADLEERLASLEKLSKEKERLLGRKEDLSLLKKLFTAQRFVNFVSTRYLHDLCANANQRFRSLTNQALQLELTENNDFLIRDFLNGGRTRSVKTLSGGQTFQAAFSLALALADSIRSGEENFFFLDEGFGTLDQESLRTVFSTLKSLRKEERTVGIISHVEELKEEIETFISVNNTDEEGSILSMSWD